MAVGSDRGGHGAPHAQVQDEVLQFDSAASQAVRSWIETMQKEWEKTLKAQLFARFSKDATVLLRLASWQQLTVLRMLPSARWSETCT